MKSKSFHIFLAILFLAGKVFAEATPLKEPTKVPTTPDIFGKLEECIKSESPDKYLELLALISQDLQIDYTENQDILSEAEDLLNSDKFQESINLLFSPKAIHFIIVPRYHLILATSYRNLKQIQEADTERYIYQSLLSKIAKTGDGSRMKPYRVLHVQAEYDLLKYQLKIDRKQRKSQNHYHIGTKDYDVHTLTSGNEIWFDITERMKILRANLKKK